MMPNEHFGTGEERERLPMMMFAAAAPKTDDNVEERGNRMSAVHIPAPFV